MAAKAWSTTLVGVDAFRVEIEAQIIGALRRFTVVGLPDGILREAKERVRCAVENSGFVFPHGEVVVSLAPASLPKRGAGFDLPIALSVLAANGQINPEALKKYIFLGELALDGTLKPVAGELAAAWHVRSCNNLSLVLSASSRYAAALSGVTVFGCPTLADAVAFLRGELELAPVLYQPESRPIQSTAQASFGDVSGQRTVKRALEIAAAGGHNVLMVGPPGSGKSMLARRIPGILPPLSLSEAIEVAKIYNAVQPLSSALLQDQIPYHRPFRAPHHTTSTAGLIGGGSLPMPGEITMSHRGILFLDEFPEFRRDALESLRDPLETKCVVIARAKERVRFPADFMLVAAMNPCPCGKYGHERLKDGAEQIKQEQCKCLISDRRRYVSRISGPILDRIDIQIEVPAVPVSELSKVPAADDTPQAAARVLAARNLQKERYQSEAALNSAITSAQSVKWCKVKDSGKKLLQDAALKYGLSARGYCRVLRVARTIADMEESENIETGHLSEALSYRQRLSLLE